MTAVAWGALAASGLTSALAARADPPPQVERGARASGDAATARADRRGPFARGHVFVTAGGGGVFFFGSPYREARHAWGYETYLGAGGPAFEAGVALTEHLAVGARGGVLFGDGGLGHRNARDRLTLWDVGVFARWMPLRARAGRVVAFHAGVQLEVGAATASMDLRDERSARTIARYAGAGVGEVAFGPVALQARLGVQYVQWPDAGGAGFDLSLSGVTLGAMLEVRP